MEVAGMAGDIDARLRRAEREFADDPNDFLEMESGEHVYFGSMAMVDDFLDLMDGNDIEDERARLYADVLDDHHHGSMLGLIIRACQEHCLEES
jgi:hypothetical protein